MTETDSFDWSPLGAEWWANTARELGATGRQARFAAAKFRGASNTQAYRESGYEASGEAGYRTGGYRLARSNVVERLLAFAAGSGTAGFDGSVDRAEARRILSGLARGSDPSIRIRACEALAKMDSEDKLQRTVEGQMDHHQAATQLLRISPEYGAVILADSYFSQEGTIWGLPYLSELAPILKRDFYPAWQRYRDAIRANDHRNDFDKLSAGPVLPIADIVGPIETKSTPTEE